ncbi:hypothetical protein SLOPH_2260 [Spraguea lophii 42_110]|uniref:Uncharacterized protein n=1 Tax=Spraguea lophii (strain 42_110) TaxID=1358809 RepID=S7XM23_SPRLO|nr:hypothetical protein SLOPH_2260 [Spraguea lophii 42_110]
MIFSHSQDYLCLYTEEKLNIYKISDFITFKLSLDFDAISSLHIKGSILFIGLFNGELYFYDIEKNKKSLITIFDSEIKCIDSLENEICICTTDGEIYIYIKAGEKYISSKIFSHNAIITQAVCTPLEYYIVDSTNRLFIYPTKSCYDYLHAPIIYKKYFFITENKKIFCRTKDAFEKIIEINENEEKIENMFFSEEGGILFISTKNKIFIVNINNREILREINIERNKCFFYDFKYNRMVEIENKENISFSYKNDILDEEEIKLKMNKIIFESDKILKVVNDFNEEDSKQYNYSEKYKNNENEKRIKRARQSEIKEYDIYQESENSYIRRKSVIEEDLFSKKNDKDLEDLFSDNEELVEELIIKEQKVEPRLFGCDKLISYNRHGYIVRLSDITFEIVYHDSNISPMKITDEEIINGCVGNGYFTIASKNILYCYDKELKWKKKYNKKINKVVCDKNIVVFLDDEINTIEIYDKKENLLDEIYMKGVYNVCTYEDEICLFTKNYMKMYKENKLEYLVCLPEFVGIYGNKIYYGNKNVYEIDKFSRNVVECDGIPLCVIENHIIALCRINGEYKIEPEPHVEYYKIEKRYDIVVQKENIEEERKDYTHNEVMPEHPSGMIRRPKKGKYNPTLDK